MVSLQEPCFVGRHYTYVILLTIPQLVLYIVGLPLMAALLILQNKKKLNDPDFRLRYGLLYRGYAKGREWWEITVALRKIAAVSIGTFGSLIGIPEVQVGLALFLGLLSIVMHLVGQPYGDPNGKSKQLHFMEFFSLVVIWFTNWGGLMLYILPGSPTSKILLTFFIIVMVSFYNVVVFYLFGKTLITAALKKRRDRSSMLNGDGVVNDSDANNTQITPSQNNDFSFSTTARERQLTATTEIVENIHKEHRQSQINLEENIQTKARKQKRKTQLRVQARSKLKKQKVLSNIEAFAALNEDEIDAMLNVMTRESHLMGEVLCRQGDIADTFYVVMNGECIAYAKKDGEAMRKLGSITQYQFFGEASLLSDKDVNNIRNAMVEVQTEVVTLMVLTKSNFFKLIENGSLNRDILDGVKKVDLERQEQNLENGNCEEKDIESSGMEL
jgi:hypothetical protein